jgi:ribosome biogenesis ATPase
MDKNTKSISQVIEEYAQTLKKLKNFEVKKDKLSSEEQFEIRNLCSKAMNSASVITLDPEVKETEKQKYRNELAILEKLASKYGSVIKGNIPTTKLEDVKGLDNVKELINNFIYLAKNEVILKTYNVKGGLGVLMYGPPGTGKSMIAEAIANAMGLPLFVVTPADIFKSYVGASEQSIRAIFSEVDACVDGAIMFIDECESIFSKRNSDTKDYKSAVTSELLQRMNGFGVDGSKRIMIAATNRPDQIDPAYLRYKRFSHQLFIDLPNAEAAKAIIESKLPKKADGSFLLSNDITVDGIIYLLQQSGKYYSAADICGVIECACLEAINQLQQHKSNTIIPLTQQMFMKAITNVTPSLSAEEYRRYKAFALQR